jgi:hypothetical protein
MPDSNETKLSSEVASTNPEASLQGVVGLDTSSASAGLRQTSASSTKLSSIRGIPPNESKALAVVLDDPKLAKDPALAAACRELGSIYRDELKQLWLVARLDPTLDRGGELAHLLRLFCEDASLRERPELLSQLYRVATAESLFGLTRAQYQERGIDFNKIRREFLVDTIRGAIDSDNITQGREPLCTMGATCKLLSKAEFLRLTTEYALDGSTTTASGAEMQMWPQFVERAYYNSEGALGDVRCARRSAGMLMVLYGMLQLGDAEAGHSLPLVERQQGLYWHQYTLAAEKLLGEQMACFHRTGSGVLIDQTTGKAVLQPGTNPTKEVDQFGYLEDQLARGNSVFIDTCFNFSSDTLSSGTEHSRHALVAESVETRNGQSWIRCSNPIGDFVNTSKSRQNYAEFFPAGTILGDRRGFWFETAANGDILVRADVLRRNLQTVLVQYGTPFTTDQSARPQFIGDPKASEVQPIIFFDFSVDIAPVENESTAAVIHSTIDDLFTKGSAPTIREPRDESEDVVDRSSGRRDVATKKKSLEEELLAAHAAQALYAEESRDEKREKQDGPDNPGFGGHGTSVVSKQSSVVGKAFEYGRDGGQEAIKPHAEETNTVAATAEPTTGQPASPVKAPVAPVASTTALGLKTLFG